MTKITITIDGKEHDVSPEDIHLEGYTFMETETLETFKAKAVERELLVYGSGYFNPVFTNGVGGRSALYSYEGDRFKCDDEGGVYLCNGDEFVTDGKGRITVERFYQNNPTIEQGLKQGLEAYHKNR